MLVPEPVFFGSVAADLGLQLLETRGFPGCIKATLAIREELNRIILHQVWETSEARDKYWTWRAERGDLMRIREQLAEEPIFLAI